MAIDRTVVDRGEGTAVVFTHGTLMDHTMFAPQIEALEDRVRQLEDEVERLHERSATHRHLADEAAR